MLHSYFKLKCAVPLVYDGAPQDDRESMYNTKSGALRRLGVYELAVEADGQEKSWKAKLGKTLMGQVENLTQERMKLWEVSAASLADDLRKCRRERKQERRALAMSGPPNRPSSRSSTCLERSSGGEGGQDDHFWIRSPSESLVRDQRLSV